MADKDNDNFNPYPPSPHPEDRPDYGRQSSGGSSLPQYGDYTSSSNSGPSYGYASENPSAGFGYGSYNGGFTGHDNQYRTGVDHYVTGWPMHRGEPTRARLGDALAFGIRDSFGNLLPYFLWGLTFFVVGIVLGMFETLSGVAVTLLSTLFVAFSYLLMQRMVFNSLSNKRVKFGESAQGFGVVRALVVTLIATIVMELVYVPAQLILDSELPNSSFESGVLPDISVLETVNLSLIFSAALLTLLATMLLSPFMFTVIMVAVEESQSVGYSLSKGLKVAAANYLPLLLVIVVSNILAVLAILFTFGLALLVAFPFVFGATSYVYRTVTGGVRPVRPVR